jgi:AcrR family transcriptional regulator
MDRDLVFSLRERNYAQTKLALLQAAIRKIEDRPLADISVKELCEAVPVSELTFYNYFSKKTDLLVYYIQIIALETAWYLNNAVKSKTSLEMIEACIDFLARKVAAEPLMMSETLAFFGQEREHPELGALSNVEQVLAFPNLPGIEELDVHDSRIESLVEPYLRKAIASGELPKELDVNEVLLMVTSIFTGLVMNLHLTEPELIKPLCQRQLRLLWTALRAEAAEEHTKDI